MPTTEREWYAANRCTHAHCPNGCEKPQPRLVEGVMACGRCLVYESEVVAMVPCTPEACGDE